MSILNCCLRILPTPFRQNERKATHPRRDPGSGANFRALVPTGESRHPPLSRRRALPVVVNVVLTSLCDGPDSGNPRDWQGFRCSSEILPKYVSFASAGLTTTF